MAISLYDVTSISEVGEDLAKATGAYDKMMLALRAQVRAAVVNQEITQQQAGELLVSTLPTVLNSAIQFDC